MMKTLCWKDGNLSKDSDQNKKRNLSKIEAITFIAVLPTLWRGQRSMCWMQRLFPWLCHYLKSFNRKKVKENLKKSKILHKIKQYSFLHSNFCFIFHAVSCFPLLFKALTDRNDFLKVKVDRMTTNTQGMSCRKRSDRQANDMHTPELSSTDQHVWPTRLFP